MPFPIYKDGKILFAGGAPAMSTDCCCSGCETCGGCSFDSASSIQNYLYIRSLGDGTPVTKFEALGDFEYAGGCTFCQKYRVYQWDIDEQEWVFDRIDTGEGLVGGFRYIGQYGWWDGNEAGKGENNPPDSYIILFSGPSGSRSGTVFSCGTCCGHVAVTYYYTDGSSADVSFFVNNPNCGTE